MQEDVTIEPLLRGSGRDSKQASRNESWAAMRSIALALASSALLLFAASEMLIAMPIPWRLYVAAAAMFAVGLLRKRPPRRQFGRLVILMSICLVAAILHLTPWSSRKVFLKDLYSIKPGMTVTEVKAIMAGYIPGTGFPSNPLAEPPGPSGELTIRGALVFRHSEEPAYNADWGIVNFRDGRVTGVEFSAD
jgi:hypothetical protein